MAAYYNEIDPFAVKWLKNLIAKNLIAPGVVDDRSIIEVTSSDLKGFTQCHFFAGIGVWSYALRKAGWSDDRQVWTGSCPCQPFSAAGKKKGILDERHLWPVWYELIKQCNPSIIFGEQVSSKDGLAWFDDVQTNLENENYATAALDLCSASVGAPHIRQRLFWVAHATSQRLQRCEQNTPYKTSQRWTSAQRHVINGIISNNECRATNGFWRDADWLLCSDDRRRPVEPGTFPLANGVTGRMGRLRAYGNAINAEVTRIFIESYLDITN